MPLCIDPAKFRTEVTSLLSSNGLNRLVLFLDQFEDVVSPVAAPGAMDAMREFLGELWLQKEAKPYLRGVVVYRTDADARLGRLWQEISGKSEGLPYFPVQGLSRGAAEDIINQTAHERSWRLETSVPEIARQLALESQKLDCADEVFPVYLQIFLKQAQQNPEERITGAFIAHLGGVSGLIGKYLEQTLGKLRARGGDWEKCRAVLESLSRSAGTKATQSLDDLARETGLSRAVLAEMLPVLINERLVRPVGHQTYEIQHDRLAATIIQGMKDTDREAKAAREFLAAKVPTFERTMVPLTPDELVYLYRHRQKIHPTEWELRVLLASLLHNIEAGARSVSPGFYWFGGSSPQDFLRWFIQIEHWAAKGRSSFQPSREWVKTFPFDGLELGLRLLRELAKDPDWHVRQAVAQALGRLGRPEDLPLLRELAKDPDWDVRPAAAQALGRLGRPEALPLLRELANEQDPDVRQAALEALKSLLETLVSGSGSEVLPLLRELAKDPSWEVRQAAAQALGRLAQPEDLPLLRELAKDPDPDVRQAAAQALGRLAQPEDLPLLRELAKEQDWHVRQAALQALKSLLEALTSTSEPKALPLLRELAEDPNWHMRRVAARALGRLAQPEDLPLLRELAKDPDPDVRRAALEALISTSGPEACTSPSTTDTRF